MKTKKNGHLTIPEPCKAKLNKMPNSKNGIFCTQCQHEVIDFRHKSDAEILAAFADPHAKVCGTFWETQLERPLIPAAQLTSSIWPRLAVGFMLMVAAPGYLLAQAPVKAPTSVSPSTAASQNPENEDVNWDLELDDSVCEIELKFKIKGEWKAKFWKRKYWEYCTVSVAGSKDLIPDRFGVVQFTLAPELVGKNILVTINPFRMPIEYYEISTKAGKTQLKLDYNMTGPPYRMTGGRAYYRDAI